MSANQSIALGHVHARRIVAVHVDNTMAINLRGGTLLSGQYGIRLIERGDACA